METPEQFKQWFKIDEILLNTAKKTRDANLAQKKLFDIYENLSS